MQIDWSEVTDVVKRYTVRISTPDMSGTGFLFFQSNETSGIATAAHVVEKAYWWEQPLRIEHLESGNTILLHHGKRGIVVDKPCDSASIIFSKGMLPLPEEPLHMVEEDKFLRVGNPIGWLGYPAISPSNLCFFTGTGSCWLPDDNAYLVDGVAINGVSGGPAFWAIGKTPILVGLVSAYMPNRATGETLPGLCIVRNLKHLHHAIKRFRSIEEARAEEADEKQGQSPPVQAPGSDG